VKTLDKPRVLVVHNRDFEHSEQDPENGSRADIRGTAEDVVALLSARRDWSSTRWASTRT
jgi:hypothetical protein